MKKIFAILLSVCLLAALCTTSVFAVDSPEGELLHKVHVITFKDGSSKTSSSFETQGTVTLKAGGGNFAFTGWVIEGDYDIISGNLKSTTLVIQPKSDLSVEESYDVPPSAGNGKSTVAIKIGDKTYYVTIISKEEGVKIAATDDLKIVEDGVIRLTASYEDFDKWYIQGDYDIISGNLNSKVLTIRPKSNLKICEYGPYDVPDYNGGSSGASNDSNISPKTGNVALELVSVITALAFVGILLSRKKTKNN